jgi:hypothetical protein
VPKLLFARAPKDTVEERKIRNLAGARHAPADWIRRAQIISLSWERLRVPQIARELGPVLPRTVEPSPSWSADGRRIKAAWNRESRRRIG